MRRTRRTTKRVPPPDSSDEDKPKKTKLKTKSSPKATPLKKQRNKKISDDSSSESDIESYLKPADQIDLNSSFFQTDKSEDTKSFAAIESNIFSGINQLSDSDSELELASEETPIVASAQTSVIEPKPTTSKINFQHLHEYTKKLEEAKQLVAKYEASKKVQRTKQRAAEKKPEDISNLLALGETKLDSSAELQASIHSSDYESYSDSEKDWEEVEVNDIKDAEESIIPKNGVEITVGMPDVMRKKKGIDLVACMKRRLNRIRKENQVLVHKVHLLCWLGHGNYVNQVLNGQDLLAMALSLIPSQHCYPPERVDLSYLEQIVKWYKNMMPNVEKLISKNITLEKALELQINRKQAYNKKMLVYIFICILRSLGLQCRLVLSFQVTPIRPPASELHSLSTKTDEVKDQKATVKSPQNSPKKDATKDNTKDKSSDSKTEKSRQDSKAKKQDLEKINDDKKGDKNKKQNTEKSKTKDAKKSKVSEKTQNTNTKAKESEASQSRKNPLSNSKRKANIKDDKRDLKTTDPKDKTPSINKTEVTESQKSGSTKKPNLLKLKPTRKSKRTQQLNDSQTETLKTNINNNENSTKLNKNSPAISQLDGANDSDDEPSTSKKGSKPNLKKLSQEETNPCPKKHPKRLKSLPNYTELNSDDDFKSDSPKNTQNIKKSKSTANLKKLQTTKQISPSASPKKEKPKRNSGNEKSVNLAKLKKESNSNSSPPKPAIRNINDYIASKSPKKKGDVRDDIITIMKGRIAQEKAAARSKLAKHSKSHKPSDDDSDYAPESVKKKHHDSDDEFYEKTKIKVKQRVKVKKDDVNEEETKKRKGVDVWIEVFLECEEKWISADVVKGQVHCINELHSRASHPISYIVAWNNDNSIKDITQRYCPNWNTVTRKLRIDKNWWDATLKSFAGRKTARDREEDEELARLQLEKPLPTTISEYKNHPLYALKRHLLKFEAIYPPDAMTLGFVRSEPVYSRDCIHTLHSREIWVKHAKVVKPGEKPYKIVKARPKYDKLSGQVTTDLPLEIFGKWQIEDYVPPTAENGIVPRNAYGNVELFKACMLPKGTVHLQLPGLNKVARKMNIDCASAVVGFDYHSGGSHPTFDGFVVCEEHSEVLIAAWYMEQEEQEKREQEKMEKRVYGNWKKLIKGLLIRERLKARYNFGGPSQAGAVTKKRKSKGPKLDSKKRKLCSGSESDNESDN